MRRYFVDRSIRRRSGRLSNLPAVLKTSACFIFVSFILYPFFAHYVLPRPLFGPDQLSARIQSVHEMTKQRGGDTVCFASTEIQCLSHAWGGLGRAFLTQLLELQGNNISVLPIIITNNEEFTSSDPTKRKECQQTEIAALQAKTVFVNSGGLSAWSGIDVIVQSAALMEWMIQFEGACRVIHVPDWLGLSSLVSQAKASGIPELENVFINVQSHGMDWFIRRDYDMKTTAERAAQLHLERTALETADGITFLNHEHFSEYSKEFRLNGFVSVIPNAVKGVSQNKISCTPYHTKNWHHLVFYGKLSFRKGYHLFMKALLQLPHRIHSHIQQISIIGPRAEDPAPLIRRLKQTFSPQVTVQVFDTFSTDDVLTFFQQHQRQAIVVLPSLLEHQSYALIDVMMARIPFIASNIWAHRAAIPKQYHQELLFDASPTGLAVKIAAIAQKGLQVPCLWSSIPLNAMNEWKLWYQHIFSTLAPPAVPKPSNSEITVVLTLCQDLNHLHRVLWSLQHQTYKLDLMFVLIVTFCPHHIQCMDISRAMSFASEVVSPLDCIDLKSNNAAGNAGAARNVGLQHSETDLVLFIDEWHLLDTTAVELFVRAAESAPQMALFSAWTTTVASFDAYPDVHAIQMGVASSPGLELIPFQSTDDNNCVMVNRKSEHFDKIIGFSELPWLDCYGYDLLMRAAAQNSAAIIPKHAFWRVQSPKTNDDLAYELYSRCFMHVARSISSEIGHAWVDTLLRFAASDTNHQYS